MWKSYIRQKQKYANGDKKVYYLCSSPSKICKNSTIHLSVLEELISKELGLKEFDSNIMIEKLTHVGIEDNTLVFHYKNGKIAKVKYENPIRPKPKHSEKLRKR